MERHEPHPGSMSEHVTHHQAVAIAAVIMNGVVLRQALCICSCKGLRPPWNSVLCSIVSRRIEASKLVAALWEGVFLTGEEVMLLCLPNDERERLGAERPKLLLPKLRPKPRPPKLPLASAISGANNKIVKANNIIIARKCNILFVVFIKISPPFLMYRLHF